MRKIIATIFVLATVSICTAKKPTRPTELLNTADRICVLTVYKSYVSNPTLHSTCAAVFQIASGNEFYIVDGSLNKPENPVWIKVCGERTDMMEFVDQLYD